MGIQRLSIRRFRNAKESSFDFGPRVNVIHGANAKGKTSILEAISLLTLGRSFRTSRLSELIQTGAEGFHAEMVFEASGVCQKVSVTISQNEKKIRHNQTPYPSLSSLIGLLPITTLTPDDDVIKGTPDSRRRFLDLQIAQCDPLYLHHLTRYQKAMRQRNILLKKGNFVGIDPWEQEMARSGCYIGRQRKTIISSLQPLTQGLHRALSNSVGDMRLTYDHHTLDNLLDAYRENRKREAKLGYSLSGPHRDDLKVHIDDHEARSYGSEGQKRTCATALRLGSWHLLKEWTGQPPLLLIDDFGISLDRTRREQFCALLPGFSQVFITSVEPLEIPEVDSVDFPL